MKGVIFNLLEEVVEKHHGEETWDALLRASGNEGAYTSLGNYPDSELTALVAAAAAALNQKPQDVVRWFGRAAIPFLAERFPQFFESHRSTRSFLLTLNNIIHPEVRKLYPGADVPLFGFDPTAADTLTLRYASPRRLCALAEGFIEGAAARFGEQVLIEQPRCMNRGDDQCALVCQIIPAQA